MIITFDKLLESKPENLVRLARALKVDDDTLTHEQLASRVGVVLGLNTILGISPNVEFCDDKTRQGYENFWEAQMETDNK
jgi:hypothetical protein